MTLQDAINRYIAWRQAHGAKYESGSTILHLFLKSVDGDQLQRRHTEQVLGFLAGKGPLTHTARTSMAPWQASTVMRSAAAT